MPNNLEPHVFQAKYYLNGFPKAGLHLLSLMMEPIASPMVEDEMWTKPWASPFKGNSWTRECVPSEKVLYKIGRLQDGRFLKGHCGYKDEIERFLWYAGIAHIFIYRDLRDIVVSQAYHVVAEDSDTFELVHPDKARYRAMGSHEEVMKAVIVGAGPYPGVLDRWQDYTAWLDVDWIHKVRFETLRQLPREEALAILQYGLARTASIFGCKLKLVDGAVDVLADLMVVNAEKCKERSTFRKGRVGDWREEFTDEIKDLFKEADTDHWLERLGYEQNDGW